MCALLWHRMLGNSWNQGIVSNGPTLLEFFSSLNKITPSHQLNRDCGAVEVNRSSVWHIFFCVKMDVLLELRIMSLSVSHRCWLRDQSNWTRRILFGAAFMEWWARFSFLGTNRNEPSCDNWERVHITHTFSLWEWNNVHVERKLSEIILHGENKRTVCSRKKKHMWLHKGQVKRNCSTSLWIMQLESLWKNVKNAQNSVSEASNSTNLFPIICVSAVPICVYIFIVSGVSAFLTFHKLH